jgi:diaminohydroxyphosphoribosylaminopyrimidine deaminase/5-amino-6-(5-phosphoribosylamino)uracil reductase
LDPSLNGGGVAALKAAGIRVETGLLEREAASLIAPFSKRIMTGMPFVHAKWAMTLDGKIASRTGDSRWISNEASRAIVHKLRGRMDAIIIGAATAERDDPLLTARPAGPRTAVRIVVDGEARLSAKSQLVQTVADAPVLVAALESASDANVNRLKNAGVEVLRVATQAAGQGGKSHPVPDLTALFRELGRREMTNVLLEGGGRLLGSAFDARLIDAVHVFVAAKILGGAGAVTPIAGLGLANIAASPKTADLRIEQLDDDIYVQSRIVWE